MLLRQFVLKTFALSLLTSILCFVVFHFFFSDKFRIIYTILPFLFGTVNVLIFYTLLKVKDSSLSKFSSKYLLCTTFKLLGSLLFIVVYLFNNRNDVIPFTSTFLSIYFLYLFHEIMSILNFFKKNEKREGTHSKT